MDSDTRLDNRNHYYKGQLAAKRGTQRTPPNWLNGTQTAAWLTGYDQIIDYNQTKYPKIPNNNITKTSNNPETSDDLDDAWGDALKEQGAGNTQDAEDLLANAFG